MLGARHPYLLSHFAGSCMSFEHSLKICQCGSPARLLGVCLMTSQKLPHPQELLPVLVGCGTPVEPHMEAFLARWRGFGHTEEGGSQETSFCPTTPIFHRIFPTSYLWSPKVVHFLCEEPKSDTLPSQVQDPRKHSSGGYTTCD